MATKSYSKDDILEEANKNRALQVGKSASSKGRKFKLPTVPVVKKEPVITNKVSGGSEKVSMAKGAEYGTGSTPTVQTASVAKVSTPSTPAPTVDNDASYWQEQLQGMGFSTGTTKSIQGVINTMSEETAAERVQKKKAQDALSAFSKASGAGAFFENPFLETSSDQILLDIEKTQQDLFTEQEEDKSALELQIEQLNRIDQANFAVSEGEAKASKSAMEQSTAQGREGVMSTANPMISDAFSSKVNTQLSNSQTRLDMAQTQRARQLKQLEKAQQDQNDELAASISESLARTGNNIATLQNDLANQQAENQRVAMDFLQSMPGGFLLGATPEEVAGSMGIGVGVANFMIKADEQKYNVMMGEQDMSSLERTYKVAQINKMIGEAQTAGMTQGQKDYMFYQNLLASDPISAKNFARQKGFDDTPSAQDLMKQQLEWDKWASDYFAENGIWPTKQNSNQPTPSGSIEDSKITGEYGGQCGEYVNNYYGSKLFGNYLKDKLEFNNSDVPVVGGAFITKNGYNLVGGNTGHVGLVTKVYADGSFDVQDSNRKGDELIGTGHISDTVAQGVVGFFDPSKAAPGWTPKTMLNEDGELIAPPSVPTPMLALEGRALGAALTIKDTILSQIRTNKLPSGDFDKWRNTANREGWLDEFNKAITDPKIKNITQKTADNFGVQAALTQYQLDEMLAYREATDLGNAKFQKFYHDPTQAGEAKITSHDKLVEQVQLKNKLTEAWDLYKRMTELGEGLQYKGSHMRRWLQTKGEEWLEKETPEALRLYREVDQITGNALVAFVKKISGVAVSEPEFQRLRKFNPNVEQPDTKFQQQLLGAIEAAEELSQAQARNFGFSSVQQMEDVIMGFIPMPSGYPGVDALNQPVAPVVQDPAGVIPVNDDPLGIINQ